MNIALIGYGKMGRAIEEAALAKRHSIVLKIDLHNTAELTRENLRKADVAIEFTGPESAFNNVMSCLDYGVPVVCGSTGWLERRKEVENFCAEKNGAFLYASNYSIGVNLFFELNKYLARLMQRYPEYAVSITETHHTGKKDAPSGTAITLAEQLLDHHPVKKRWVNHSSQVAEELAIRSERIDPAAGTHEVTYISPVDDIAIIHTAHNRQGFAGGAVLAAEFLYGKKGIFGMKDVLGL